MSIVSKQDRQKIIRYTALSIVSGLLNFGFLLIVNNAIDQLLSSNEDINNDHSLLLQFGLVTFFFLLSRWILNAKVIAFSQKIYWNLRDRVLKPAGMQDVALGWRDPDSGTALRHLAMPHHVQDGRIKKQPYPDDDFRAAAGMVANARAVAAFDIAYDAGLLVPEEHRARLTERQVIGSLGDYRLGWWLEDYNSKRLLWHSGKDDQKYSAIYLKIPEDRITLIVLANSEAIWNAGSSVVKALASLRQVWPRCLEALAN